MEGFKGAIRPLYYSRDNEPLINGRFSFSLSLSLASPRFFKFPAGTPSPFNRPMRTAILAQRKRCCRIVDANDNGGEGGERMSEWRLQKRCDVNDDEDFAWLQGERPFHPPPSLSFPAIRSGRPYLFREGRRKQWPDHNGLFTMNWNSCKFRPRPSFRPLPSVYSGIESTMTWTKHDFPRLVTWQGDLFLLFLYVVLPFSNSPFSRRWKFWVSEIFLNFFFLWRRFFFLRIFEIFCFIYIILSFSNFFFWRWKWVSKNFLNFFLLWK